MRYQSGTIARIHVSQGATDSWPIAERVPGGWQSGEMFYPDSDVVRITTTYLRVRPDGEQQGHPHDHR